MKNGWVTRTVIGFLFVVIFTAITTISGYTISNDKDSRARDEVIQREAVESERRINKSLSEIINVQNDKFTEILVEIAKMQRSSPYVGQPSH